MCVFACVCVCVCVCVCALALALKMTLLNITENESCWDKLPVSNPVQNTERLRLSTRLNSYLIPTCCVMHCSTEITQDFVF